MSERFHVIKDPVHGSMQFTTQEDNWIKPFIDSENFQRLRNIKQLGLADWVFPGAEHTRFNHCLGCCYISNQICNKLDIKDEDQQIVSIACLLHDIGHGPFSHAFEDIFYQHAIRHERWTPLFLREYCDSNFLEKFNKRNPKFPLDENKIEKIANLIMHRNGENQLLNDIVSSQLDADRLDYLLRDSHFCGVNYGEYDLRWLLHCMTIVQHEEKPRLGITKKGIGVVEHYLMARRLMMRNVYKNGKKDAGEYLLKAFLKYLAQGIEEDRYFTKLEPKSLIDFLQKTNEFNQQAEKTKNFPKLLNAFLEENYASYKQLYDYDILSLIRQLAHADKKHPAITLAKRLYARRIPKVIYGDSEKSRKIDEVVKEFKENNKNQIEDWQIAILNLPHLSYEMSNDPILIEDFSGNAKFLHDNSLMVNALSDKNENTVLVIVDREIANQSWLDELYSSLQGL